MNSSFLSENKRSSEFFVVIDNTEWPEALWDKTWLKPNPYSEETSKTVFLEIHVSTYFTSTAKHQAVISLFSVIMVVELFLFFITGVVYIYQSDQL